MKSQLLKTIFDESIVVFIMLLFLVVPWFVVGLNIWGWFFVCVSILLGLFEFISYKITGKTLSQTFWDFMKQHPKTGIVVLSSVSIGWIILMLHLLHL